jgi:hypothetical protein
VNASLLRADEGLDDAFDADADCSVCGGDGYTECSDPLGCTRPHVGSRFTGDCLCSACGGSGLAVDQVVW